MGGWRRKFDRAKTTTAVFHGPGGKDEKVQMMSMKAKMPVAYTQDGGTQPTAICTQTPVNQLADNLNVEPISPPEHVSSNTQASASRWLTATAAARCAPW